MKEYIKPKSKVLELNIETELLAATGDGIGITDEEGNGIQLSRRKTLFNTEQEE